MTTETTSAAANPTNAENTARKLQNITGSSTLDQVPEQRRSIIPAAPRTGNQAVDRQIEKNRDMPSHNMREMAATARELIDNCEGKREAMVAWGQTQKEDNERAYTEKTLVNQKTIEHHTSEIARLGQLIDADTQAYQEAQSSIDTKLTEEVTAIEKMIAAQQGVIDILAKNVTPAKGKAKA